MTQEQRNRLVKLKKAHTDEANRLYRFGLPESSKRYDLRADVLDDIKYIFLNS